MNFISADYIFPVTTAPLKNGIVVYDHHGTVTDVLPEGQVNNELVKHYNGILVPGFINSHLHLELSHLKNQIEAGGGLCQFLPQILSKRNTFTEDAILSAIENADRELWHNGVVAAGDISNTNHSFIQKAKSKIVYHTFIELFGLKSEQSKFIFENGNEMLHHLNKQTAGSPSEGHYSITPHAPYSVSDQLFQLLNKFSGENNCILTIHNQETEAENELFQSGTGELYDLFIKMGFELNEFKATNNNSLYHTLNRLNSYHNLLLVHNTYTTAEELEWAQNIFKNIFWCFCPNANLYIENRLPEFEIFISAKAICCIGTDSYASNYSLSILDEMKTISRYAPGITFETILNWATLNGAQFLNIANRFGSFEKGKQPGINLIENFDNTVMQLTADSSLRKII